MASADRNHRRVPIRIPRNTSLVLSEIPIIRQCDRFDAVSYGLPPSSANTPTADGTTVNALSDDLLAEIFSRLPSMSSKIALQSVCRRWEVLHRCPDNAAVWGALNLRISNRYSSDTAPLTHMTLEVLDKCNPFSRSHVVHAPANLLEWLTPRAGGFHVLNLILDVEVPWENEVVACRRALWFVMTNTILPILGLLSATLKEVVVTVADTPDVPLSEYAALYSAPSAVACLAHALGGLPKLDFLMLDCLWLQGAHPSFFAGAPQPHLRVVILRGCMLRSLPNLPQLHTLQGLDLSCNPISLQWLELCLPQLLQLESLILCNCSLTSIPASIGNLRHLRKLYLNHNVFSGETTWAPAALQNLDRLELLTLQHCAIRALPDAIGRLASLTALELQGNQLEALPACLGRLTTLQSLQLSSNSLTTIADATLSTLCNLRALDLSRQATRVTSDGMALDLYSTVRVAAPLLGLLALHKLQVLRLPLVELSDCEVHTGGMEDVAAVASTVLHLNALRAAVVRGALARGAMPPSVDAE